MQTSMQTSSAGPSSPYTVRHIPARTRYIKATAWATTGILLSAWLLHAEYVDHVLSSEWIYAVPIIGIAGLFAFINLFLVERKHLAQSFVYIPLRDRLKPVRFYASLAVATCIVAWALQAIEGLLNYWWYVWPAPAFALVASAVALLHRRDSVLTPEAQVESARIEASKAEKQARIEETANRLFKKRYVRYPLAAVGVWLAIWIGGHGSTLDVLTGVLVALAAAFLAWDLLLIALLVAAALWFVHMLAALPVSLAIIVGALIIASAAQNK